MTKQTEQIGNSFINNFKTQLETTKNKDYLVENEISQIKLFTSMDDVIPNFMGELNYANETNSVFNLMEMGNRVFFNSVFNDYLMNGEITCLPESTEEDEEIGCSSIREDESLMSEAHKATDFADYYLWLKKLQQKPILNNSNSKPITHKQKLLMLHYLGLNISDVDNTKIAKLLANSLGLGFDNSRKWLPLLSYNNDTVRTKSNLKSVKLLFESAGLQEIAKKIEIDIENTK